jgi:hypothetical protein
MNTKKNNQEDSVVLTELLTLIKEDHKPGKINSDPQNIKVQKKFDEAFKGVPGFDPNIDLDALNTHEEEKKKPKKENNPPAEIPVIDLSFSNSDVLDNHKNDIANKTPDVHTNKAAPTDEKPPEEVGGMDFDLDVLANNQNFNEDTKKTVVINLKDLKSHGEHLTKSNAKVLETIKDSASKVLDATKAQTEELLPPIDLDAELTKIETQHSQHTDDKATVIASHLGELNLPDLNSIDHLDGDLNLDSLDSHEEFSIPISASSASLDPVSSAESKNIIEATINDIVRERPGHNTAEFKLDNFSEVTTSNNLNDFNLDFNKEKTNIMNNVLPINSDSKKEVESSFSNMNFENDALSEVAENSSNLTTTNNAKEMMTSPEVRQDYKISSIAEDEYIKIQSTMRQLREERETLLQHIKSLKLTQKEYEQDNLTLKAALDESKIEVSIVRKRIQNEIEDYKFRLAMSEEKRNMAEEKAKQLDRIKEKFEQKTRIDINVVRQREKELETKLEMMALDSDSQVQARDQKILELRRKIDSLEFNMENATIREQKSNEDKRKLEDKLNKMMKTLRNSIKNLEDDIESSTDEFIRTDKNK